MRLLALLHRLGVNAALVAGLMLMPAVVAAGFLADRGGAGDLGLRGPIFAGEAAPVSTRPAD